MLWILIVLIVLIALYLFCLAPNRWRGEQMKPFEEVYIAHRGLFDNSQPWPENSLPAFRRAVEAGYGIELDIQLTADHQMVVFHDGDLKRMCGVDKMVYECTYEELCGYDLLGTGVKIPLFSEVLELVDGKVPLIVEVKSEGDWKETTRTMAEMMEDYEGVYCMESFHPLAVAWYRKHCPHIIRGQLSTDYFKDEPKRSFGEKFVLTNLLMNFRARPDFIAYNHRHVDQFSYRLCRKLFRVVNVAWTIKNPDQLKKAKRVFSVLIFDSFIPEENP